MTIYCLGECDNLIKNKQDSLLYNIVLDLKNNHEFEIPHDLIYKPQSGDEYNSILGSIKYSYDYLSKNTSYTSHATEISKQNDTIYFENIFLYNLLPFYNFIVVEVELNGVTGNFIIDTGFEVSYLDYTKLPKYNLEFVEKINQLYKFDSKVKHYRSNSLRLSSLNITDKLFACGRLNLNYFYKNILEIDGIIGWDIISELNIILNYRDKFIIINPTQENISLISQYSLIRLPMPYLYLKDQNGIDVLTSFDTGSDMSFFTNTFLRKNNYKLEQLQEKYIFSYNGKFSIYSAKTANCLLFFGNNPVEDILVTNDKVNGFPKNDFVLGANAFQNKIIYLNNRNKIISILNSE